MYTSTVRFKLIEIFLRIFLQKRYFLQNSKIGSLIDNLTDQKLILNSKLLYIYLTMPKAKRKDMEKLVPFVYKVEPDAVRDELYSHYGIK